MFSISPSIRIVSGYKCCIIYDSDNKKVYEINKDLGRLILKTKKFSSFEQFRGICQNSLQHIYSEKLNINSIISKIRAHNIYILETQRALKPEFKFDIVPPEKPHRSKIEITSSCNLRCQYCYAYTNAQNCQIPKQKVVDIIKELSDLGVKHIEFTGGEPLLNTNLRDYIKYALSCLMKVRVATNGTLLNNDIINFLMSNNVQVQVSLHETLQHFLQKCDRKDMLNSTVVKNIQEIAKLKPELLSITHTVAKDSIDSIDDFIAYAKKLNIKVILGRPFKVGRATKNWDSVKASCCEISSQCFVEDTECKQISFRSTPCNVDSINILYNGDVSTCVLLRDGNAIIGNIYKSTLPNIWKSDKRKYMSSVQVDNIPICSSCEHKYICGGGCMAGSYSLVGKVGEPFPYCNFQKEKVKKYYNEKYKTTDI